MFSSMMPAQDDDASLRVDNHYRVEGFFRLIFSREIYTYNPS